GAGAQFGQPGLPALSGERPAGRAGDGHPGRLGNAGQHLRHRDRPRHRRGRGHPAPGGRRDAVAIARRIPDRLGFSGGARAVSTNQVVHPASLHGSLRVPGDKSSSHRALMLSALASGPSTIVGLSPGQDVAATSAIMVQLGASRHNEGDRVTVVGPTNGLVASTDPLECAHSGTTMRLLAGIVSGVAGKHTLVGDASLSTRPMDRVATPLNLMGASVSGRGEKVTAPLHIVGSSPLHGIDYAVPVASAQIKSAILFAALSAAGPTSVHEDVLTRTTSEDMFRLAGL